jgi:hypothetical protein
MLLVDELVELDVLTDWLVLLLLMLLRLLLLTVSLLLDVVTEKLLLLLERLDVDDDDSSSRRTWNPSDQIPVLVRPPFPVRWFRKIVSSNSAVDLKTLSKKS